MSIVRFISDLHFGHEWMAKHRGFLNAEEQDEHIIKMWNKVVNKKDLVYILGDVTMENAKLHAHKLGKLNGTKILVGGNHDMKGEMNEILKYIHGAVGMVDYKGYTLTHCPIHPTEVNFYRGNIHGHIHEKYITKSDGIDDWIDSKYINVCCECINYTPITLDEVIDLQNKLKDKPKLNYEKESLAMAG